MRLAVFNGSPRGVHSSSHQLVQALKKGFLSVEGNVLDDACLMVTKKREEYRHLYQQAEGIVLVFPLYCDSMPAIVKEFIEDLADCAGKSEGKSIGFVIHSGFPEAIHGRALERYLEKLAQRLGANYLGTVIKGGTEGTKEQLAKGEGPVYEQFVALGRTLGTEGKLDQSLVKALAGPDRFPRPVTFILNLMSLIGTMNTHWDQELKKNGVFKKRFARPYQSQK